MNKTVKMENQHGAGTDQSRNVCHTVFTSTYIDSDNEIRHGPVYFLLNDVMVLAFKCDPYDKRAVRVQCLGHKHRHRHTDTHNTHTHMHAHTLNND